MKKWAWIVIIAVVLLVIGYFLMANKGPATNTNTNTGSTGTGGGTPQQDPTAGTSTSSGDFAAIDNSLDNLA